MITRRPASPRRGGASPQVLRAVLRLRELILTGALAPGKRVAELTLVHSTGVSRTPLRIAMERLEHEGLLARRARGGFVVRAFTLQDIEDAIDVRGVLEGSAARAAAERPHDAGDEEKRRTLHRLVAELDAVVRALPAMPAFERYVFLNEEFHHALMELSGNAMLRKLAGQVLALPFASPSAFLRIQASTPEFREILTIAQEHHRAIVEAIDRREGARADALAREHARLALKNLHAALRDRDRLSRVPGAGLLRFAESG